LGVFCSRGGGFFNSCGGFSGWLVPEKHQARFFFFLFFSGFNPFFFFLFYGWLTPHPPRGRNFFKNQNTPPPQVWVGEGVGVPPKKPPAGVGVYFTSVALPLSKMRWVGFSKCFFSFFGGLFTFFFSFFFLFPPPPCVGPGLIPVGGWWSPPRGFFVTRGGCNPPPPPPFDGHPFFKKLGFWSPGFGPVGKKGTPPQFFGFEGCCFPHPKGGRSQQQNPKTHTTQNKKPIKTQTNTHKVVGARGGWVFCWGVWCFFYRLPHPHPTPQPPTQRCFSPPGVG